MSRPNLAVVLNPHGTEMLSIDLSFQLMVPAIPAPRQENIKKSLARPKLEPLARTLERVRLLAAPAEMRSGGSRHTKEELLACCPPARVLDKDGVALDESIPNDIVWASAKTLQVGEAIVDVLYNVPTVTNVAPPAIVIAKLPAICTNLRLMFAQSHELIHEWIALDKAPPRGKPGKGARNEPPPPQEDLAATGSVVGRDMVFIPPAELIGKHLLYRCRPNAEGSLWTEVTTSKVVAPRETGWCPQPRWELTRGRTESPVVRLVSYNILHDAFATSEFAKTRLYPFCTPQILDLNYRRARVFQELSAYNADICCLQECGKDVYEKYFEGVFRSVGFDSIFTRKCGQSRDGLCILYRSERFEKLDHRYVKLMSATLLEKHPELAEKIRPHTHLFEALRHVTSVGAITTLVEKQTGNPIIIGNTHLFYHPDACHIRGLQTYMLLCAVLERREEVAKAFPELETVPVVMCGDFNFNRPTVSYQLMTRGYTDKDHESWTKGLKFWWGVDKGIGLGEAEDDAVAAAAAAGPNPSLPTVPMQEGEQETVMESQAAAMVQAAVADGSGTSTSIDPPTTYFSERLEMRIPSTAAKETTACTAQTSSSSCEHFIDVFANEPSLKYTNYTILFKEIIDHIFISPNGVEFLRSLPMPPEEDVSKEVAIPSSQFPSDHIALVADVRLTWKRKEEQ